MKQLHILALIAVVVTAFVPSSSYAAIADNVRGHILLQVESAGEAWYVDPVTDGRYYLRNGEAAYTALRAYGLGITNADIAMIPVGVEDRFEEEDGDGDGLGNNLEIALGTHWGDADSDDDGFSDYQEVVSGHNPLGPGVQDTDTNLADRLKGRILLQVESRGEAWYVHPDNGRRYYMADGDAAYQIMRYLSLGITNVDLAQVPIVDGGNYAVACADDDYDCFAAAIHQGVSSDMNLVSNPLIDLLYGDAAQYIEQRVELSFTPAVGHSVAQFRNYTAHADVQFSEAYIQEIMAEESITQEEVLEAEADVRDSIQQLLGYDIQCSVDDTIALMHMVNRWGEGQISSKDYDLFTCTDNATELGFVSQFGGN